MSEGGRKLPYGPREPEEDTGAIQTFAVTPPDDGDIDIENPDVETSKEMLVDFNAAQAIAMETAWLNAASEFQKQQKEQKNYPRIDVMVDKNCLVSYTGHMEDFPANDFQEIIDKVIVARIDIEQIVNERVKHMPRDKYEQTGYM